jgi:hypothetical protein
MILMIAALMINVSNTANAQVAINADGSAPDASAILDVKSSTQGVLIPRLTAAQRTTLSSTAVAGMLVYQDDVNDDADGFYFFTGTEWQCLNASDKNTPDKLADSDSDTNVEVEQNTDEDHIHFTTADTVRMTIDQLGRTGIGTTTPYNDLTIYSDQDNNGITFRTADNSFKQGINFRNSGGYYVWNIFRREAAPGRADLIFANAKKSLLGDLTDRVVFKDGGAVGIGTSPDASAILDVESTDKGFLPPRMTKAERDAITSPADGLIIYNTNTDCLNFYAGGHWNETCGKADVPTVFNPTTGETWMDRNLGASRVATSSTDALAYGDLFQWGRAREGHESRTSGTISINATTAVPNAGNSWDGLFIVEPDEPRDWITPQDNSLWQGVSGTNNPCPRGFRLPTAAEWDAERLSWSSDDAAGAFGSPLKLVTSGYRNSAYGSLEDVGSRGKYWSSTIEVVYTHFLFFGSNFSYTTPIGRAEGHSVRCILD